MTFGIFMCLFFGKGSQKLIRRQEGQFLNLSVQSEKLHNMQMK